MNEGKRRKNQQEQPKRESASREYGSMKLIFTGSDDVKPDVPLPTVDLLGKRQQKAETDCAR